MTSTTSSSAAAPRKRGRPAAAWWTLAEVAEQLGLPRPVLERLLKVLPGALPGAVEHDLHGYVVPSLTLRALKERREPVALIQEATPAEVAEAMRLSDKTIYRWLDATGPNGEKLLKSRKVAGRVLIDVRSIYELPEKLPSWAVDDFSRNRKEAAHAGDAA